MHWDWTSPILLQRCFHLFRDAFLQGLRFDHFGVAAPAEDPTADVFEGLQFKAEFDGTPVFLEQFDGV